MALRVYKFRDIVEMELFLRGGLLGGDVSRGVVGLVGKTLTFTAPAGNVTFVTENRENDMLLLADIKAQTEAAIANLTVLSVGGHIAFVHSSTAAGVALSATDSEAKSLLGFRRVGATTGKVYGVVPGTPPAYLDSYASYDNSHVLVVNE